MKDNTGLTNFRIKESYRISHLMEEAIQSPTDFLNIEIDEDILGDDFNFDDETDFVSW